MLNLRLITIAILFLGFTLANAQLRIQKVHETLKGETLSSIASLYDVPIEDLTKVNPDISSNPSKKFKSGYLINIPAKAETISHIADTLSVAVVLPFTSEGKEGSRCVEFYRGLLMSCDAERQDGRCLKVIGIEEPIANQDITEVIAQLNEITPDVIIGPLYPSHFSPISVYAKNNEVKNLIPFSSKVQDSDLSPYTYILNTPENLVVENGYKLFRSVFNSCRCVVVPTADASEKKLINSLLAKVMHDGDEVVTLSQDLSFENYKETLDRNNINVLLFDGDDQQQVLNILRKISEFNKQLVGYNIAVVGHNAWQQFSMEYNDLLCSLNTYILAQDFYNAYSKDVIDFEEQYFRWFKEYPLLLHPRMGELGYDTGIYLFSTTSQGQNLGKVKPYLQTNFHFEKGANEESVNTHLMFIRFAPNYKLELIEFKK